MNNSANNNALGADRLPIGRPLPVLDRIANFL